MTLSAYFAAAGEHQQLAWMSGSTLEVLVDSAVSNGQVLIMRSDTARGSGVPVHVHQREDETATILEVIAPGGLEQAFREAGWDLRTPAPDGWACTPDAVATAMAKVGCTILGPPPSSARDNPIAAQSQ
jgi:hypothetical protein